MLPNYGEFAEDAVRAAPEFEDMGFGGLWLTDHVIGIEAYRPLYDDNWLEMLTTLGFMAAATRNIRLGTGILVAPYRDAVPQSKMLATIDILSGGRLDVGVGVGWSRREFQALGRGDDFDLRGRLTDEVLEIFTDLCRGGEHSYDREWSKVSKIRFEPAVKQTPHPPLWIGAMGLGAAPMRRAAKHADNWHPTGVSPDGMREGGERLDAMARRKIPRSIRLPIADPATPLPDLLRRYEDSGCVQAAVDFRALSLDELRRRAEALIGAMSAVRA